MEKWISVEDELPKEAGYYNTKMVVGSMAPKIHIGTTRFKLGNYPEFVKGDWIKVTHWQRGKLNIS